MNPAPLVNQLQRFRRVDLLIDTNLLVLYFVEGRRPDLITTFSRTRHSTPEDFELLKAFLLLFRFRRMKTTPHVLTELSYLLRQFTEPLRSELLRWVTEILGDWTESFTPAKTLARDPAFSRLGLTDTANADCSSRKCVVRTDDFVLSGLLKDRGHLVVRLVDLRTVSAHI